MTTNDSVERDPDFAAWAAERKAKEAASPHGICPGCDGELRIAHDHGVRIRRCKECGGYIALEADRLTYDDVCRIVAREWHPAPNTVRQQDQVYYDLMYQGRKGWERIHGWMDRKSRKIVQTG